MEDGIYSSGEDTLFLKDCICNGLKVYSTNTVLGRCSKRDTSTWFTGCNEKYFYDSGALMNYLSHFAALQLYICNQS